MKNVIKMFLIILAVLCLSAPIKMYAITDVTVPELVLAGDMDNDFDFDATDLILLKRVILGVNSDYNFVAADVNEDQKINIKDLAALKIKIANLEDSEDDGEQGGGTQINPGQGGGYFPGSW